ncbi:hypothetical protein BCR42DRAFT_407490 [Absidia repens]|uniref:BZIP domain-containing protein n=1 Tax=Absidia repens TaxID=90262 RepID=A0A1X2ISB4_9FUNG|nr:hypothetical protein BCR42DRAFT_407490 [Absidia repens]
MSTQSSGSGSGSDTSLDPHEHLPSHMTGSKRKLVIDTRRAEQNRAAQRAFRQRKELYVKELENKVRDMEILKDRVKRLEVENERLKYRVWEFESSPNSTSTAATGTEVPAVAVTNNNIPRTSTSSYHSHQSSNGEDESESGRYSQLNHCQKTSNTFRSTETNGNHSPTEPLSHPTIPTSTATTTTTVTHHILPPPSPSPSVFRPIPVAYWDKESTSKQQQHESIPQHHHNGDNSTTHSEQGRVLDDLASILRTRHRPPIRQQQEQQHQPLKPEPMHT